MTYVLSVLTSSASHFRSVLCALRTLGDDDKAAGTRPVPGHSPTFRTERFLVSPES